MTVNPEPTVPIPPRVPDHPCEQDVRTARQLLTAHRRIFVPEPCCKQCLRMWPCPDFQWAQLVILIAPDVPSGRTA